MTYILGAKCNDGVVLVADRKIIHDDDTVEYEDKLFRPSPAPIVYGSSGSTFLFQNFKEESFIAAQKHKGAIQWPTYKKNLEDITKRLNKRYTSGGYEFDVLVAVQGQDINYAILHHIYPQGYAYLVKKCQVIGTGKPYGSIFVNKYCRRKEGKSMQDIAELGYFIIRNIEENELDRYVGLDKRHPQIYYIPNQGEIREASEQELNVIKTKVDGWLSKYNGQVENLFV